MQVPDTKVAEIVDGELFVSPRPASPHAHAATRLATQILPPFDRVGLYTTEPAVPQFEKLAVNLLDANESNIQPKNEPPGDIGKRDEKAEGTGKGRTELWWFLAAFGLLVLFVEWWVYTRRVHL